MTMKDCHNLQRLRFRPIDDQLGVNRKEFHRLVCQVLAPVARARCPRQKNNPLADGMLNTLGNLDAGLSP